MKYAAVATIMCLTIGACSMGQPIPQSVVAGLRPGITTASDVEATLGPPSERVNGKTGFALAWVHAHSGPYGIGAGSESLAVLFDYDTGKMVRILSQSQAEFN
jgi:hypothetical protein